MKNSNWLLISGDIFAIAVVTYIGFATHNEADLSFLPRMLAVFFPVTLSWFLIAPWFGLFQTAVISDFKQLWRPVLAMIFAAPLAALLRGLWLNAPIIPVFGLVLASTSALGMLLWRGIYVVLNRR